MLSPRRRRGAKAVRLRVERDAVLMALDDEQRERQRGVGRGFGA
jgi:hypothetical protein